MCCVLVGATAGMVTAAVAGGDGGGLAGVPEEMLLAMIGGGLRMVSWATWLELSAVAELAARNPAVPQRPRTARPPAPRRPRPGHPRHARVRHARVRGGRAAVRW